MTALQLDPARSKVIVETRPRGMLARLGHDLRFEARGARGVIADERRAEARFPVDGLALVQSRRHGTEAWGAPSSSDIDDVEERVRRQVFPGLDAVVVRAALDDGERAAALTVEARKPCVRRAAVQVSRGAAASGEVVEVRGEVTLSLAELGGAQPQVPLGALQLDDAVVVRFHVVFAPRAS